MNKDKITNRQTTIFLVFLLNSFISLFGYHSITILSKNDAIISIIIGTIFTLLLSHLFFTIFKFNKQKNILEKIELLFPKIKNIFFIFIFISVFLLLIFSIKNISTFINYYSLKENPVFIVTLTLLITIFYISTKKLDTIFKVAEICFYIYVFIMIMIWIGSLKYINLENLNPLFTTSIFKIIKSSLIYSSSSIIPFFMFLMIPFKKIENKKNTKQAITKAIIYSSIIIFLNLLLIISVLGIELTNIYTNPDMIIYKKISFLNILERIETTISFNNILNSFFYILLLIYLLKELFKIIFPKKKKKETVFLFLTILVLLFSGIFINIPIIVYFFINVFYLVLTAIIYIRVIYEQLYPSSSNDSLNSSIL